MAAEAAAVLVCHGRVHQDGALAGLRAVMKRALPRARGTIVVVDNALAGDVEIALDAQTTVVSGDNRAREFSGWERGVDWLGRAGALARAEVLLLANDTLHRNYGADWLGGFTPTRAGTALAAGGLLGWIDAYPRPIEVYGRPLLRWVRTSLVLGRRDTLLALRPFVVPAEELFAESAAQPFRLPSPLSERYRDYLLAWITGDGSRTPEFVFKWHSATRLTGENLRLMQAKLRSIVCEHNLSARAVASGVPLFDVRA
jgi:hypothetical protein